MQRFIIVLTAVLFTVLQISEASNITITKNVRISKESTELRLGDCNYARASDLVFEKSVDLPGLPLIYRKATAKYSGDGLIYCIMVLTTRDRNEGSTVEITAGGLHHNYLTLEMRSHVNLGLGYSVQIFGHLPPSKL